MPAAVRDTGLAGRCNEERTVGWPRAPLRVADRGPFECYDRGDPGDGSSRPTYRAVPLADRGA